MKALFFALLLLGLAAGCATVPAASNYSTGKVVRSQDTSSPAILPNATRSANSSASALAQPSSACPAAFTIEQTEGPFYKAGSPERTNLTQADTIGEPITLSGYVYDPDCQPVVGAWLDFWQSDGNGNYDLAGYNLRGHQFTDASGRYVLETVMPGEYPGRTSHIHVKLRADNGTIVTSQIYFPGVAQNAQDSIFVPSMVVNMTNASGQPVAYFNFKIRR